MSASVYLPLWGPQGEFGSRFATSSGNLEADGSQKCIQIVTDSLIQAIELAALLFDQNVVAAEWRQQTGGERRINLFEELAEDQADRIALADQSIATGVRDLLDQAFDAQLGEVITERRQRVRDSVWKRMPMPCL